LLELTGSSLIRTGVLKLAPPLVLRENIALVPPPELTLAIM
jgi:hypothetical protein